MAITKPASATSFFIPSALRTHTRPFTALTVEVGLDATHERRPERRAQLGDLDESGADEGHVAGVAPVLQDPDVENPQNLLHV